MEYQIVSSTDAQCLRALFIDKFVDKTTEYYKQNIATLKAYPDGMRYDGYLWDTLKEDYSKIERSMEKSIEYLKRKDIVLVMWDLYSDHRVSDGSILAHQHPKDSIIQVKAEALCEAIEEEWHNYSIVERYLPEDIYIFDSSMNWFVIFTHEGYDHYDNPELGEDDYLRICFVYQDAGKIGDT